MSAKSVKIVSSLCMVIGIIGVMAGSSPVGVLLLLGFFGFIVGRFME